MNELTITMSEDEFTKSVNKIKGVIGKIENGYISIAADLAKIKEQDGYLYGNYENIYDFAKAEFNMARGSVSNILAVEKVVCDEAHKYIGCMKNFKLTIILYLLKQVGMTPVEIREKVADGILTSNLTLESVKNLFPCNESLTDKKINEQEDTESENEQEDTESENEPEDTESENEPEDTESESELRKFNIEFDLECFDEKEREYQTALLNAFYQFVNNSNGNETIMKVTFTAR